MLLLADFTPISPAAQSAAISLLGIALTLVLIRAAVRRQPPLESEIVKLNSAVEGLQATVAALKEIFDKLPAHAEQIRTLQDQVRTLEKHREEDQRSNRTYTRESGERIYKRIDELNDSVNANFKSIENRLGHVAGAMELMTQRMSRAPFDR